MMFPIVFTIEMGLIMPAHSKNIASGMKVVFFFPFISKW